VSTGTSRPQRRFRAGLRARLGEALPARSHPPTYGSAKTVTMAKRHVAPRTGAASAARPASVHSPNIATMTIVHVPAKMLATTNGASGLRVSASALRPRQPASAHQPGRHARSKAGGSSPRRLAATSTDDTTSVSMPAGGDQKRPFRYAASSRPLRRGARLRRSGASIQRT
jgi:hypothetical protein